MTKQTEAMETDLQDTGDFHRQVALFLMAVYKSEHAPHPHPIETRWMTSVIRRIASQRNQTVTFDANLLDAHLRHELATGELATGEVESRVSWALARLREVQDATA